MVITISERRVRFRELSGPLKAAVVMIYIMAGLFAFSYMVGLTLAIIEGIY